MDSNGDGAVNLSDAVVVFAFLFAGGPAPELAGDLFVLVSAAELRETASFIELLPHLEQDNLFIVNVDGLIGLDLDGGEGNDLGFLDLRGLGHLELYHSGDFNGDGKVSLDDGIDLAKYLQGVGSPPPCLAAADANRDGTIDQGDVERIASVAMGRSPDAGVVLRVRVDSDRLSGPETRETGDGSGELYVRIVGLSENVSGERSAGIIAILIGLVTGESGAGLKALVERGVYQHNQTDLEFLRVAGLTVSGSGMDGADVEPSGAHDGAEAEIFGFFFVVTAGWSGGQHAGRDSRSA